MCAAPRQKDDRNILDNGATIAARDVHAASPELIFEKSMFIVDRNAYVRARHRAMLSGEPFETLVDACRRQAAEEAAAKVSASGLPRKASATGHSGDLRFMPAVARICRR